MIAVGVDVSKSKSTVAILNGDGSIRAKPFDVHHVADELQAFVCLLRYNRALTRSLLYVASFVATGSCAIFVVSV